MKPLVKLIFPTHTCPHCCQLFQVPLYKQGILFCPYCQNSILPKNRLDKSIEQQKGLLHFVFSTIIHGKFGLFFICLFVGSLLYFQTYDESKLLPIFLTFIAFVILFLVVMTIRMLWLNRHAEHGCPDYLSAFNIRHHTLEKGVDTINDVANESIIRNTLYELENLIKTTPCCPICHSQKLTSTFLSKQRNATLIFGKEYPIVSIKDHDWQVDDYYCLHCQSILRLNRTFRKSESKREVFRVIFFMLMFSGFMPFHINVIIATVSLLVAYGFSYYIRQQTPVWQQIFHTKSELS